MAKIFSTGLRCRVGKGLHILGIAFVDMRLLGEYLTAPDIPHECVKR
jgi:hypothetical protein